MKLSNNSLVDSECLDYKNVHLLTQYLSEQGKILPKRITGLNNKQQRRMTKNIKRARILCLIPYINR